MYLQVSVVEFFEVLGFSVSGKRAFDFFLCVTVCCNGLQCVAVCCSGLGRFAICCSVLQCALVVGIHEECACDFFLCVAVCCSMLKCIAVCCNVLQ